MGAGPIWDWVDGDPRRAAQFGFITGLLIGIAALFTAAYTLYLLGAVGAWTGPTFSLSEILAGLGLLIGLESVLLLVYPRRYPIFARIGLSPAGLRLGMSFRDQTVSWRKVESVGRDWVALDTALLTVRYRLTLNQALRIRQYLRLGDAIPAAPIGAGGS
jgi:hypothetical protein